MEKSWKFLYDFDSYEQAQFVLQTLEHKGIPCLLLDEHSSKFINYFQTYGGVRLMVDENDFEEAASIVKEVINFKSSPSTLDQLDQLIGHNLFGQLNVIYKLILIFLIVSAIIIVALMQFDFVL